MATTYPVRGDGDIGLPLAVECGYERDEERPGVRSHVEYGKDSLRMVEEGQSPL